MTATVLAYIPSPPQGVWYLGPFPLRAYALFIIVGIVAALTIGDRRWAARGGEPGVIYDIALWAVPFGLIGGRLYHVITDWSTYFGPGKAGPIAALRIWDGGLGIWGAVALGGIGAWIACRRRGIPLPAFGDAIAPGIVLAQAIGRLGNYFNQELYGRETTLPWGLEIYERVNSAGQLDMLNGVSTGRLALDYAVHPTFLYELLWNLLVFAVLIIVDRKFKIGHGRLFALYVAAYCVGRFWIELMRSDTATLLAGIRINTFTATFVFIGAVVYIISAPKGREDPATLRGNLDDESRVEELAVAAAAAATGVAAAAKVADEDEARDETPDVPESGEGGLEEAGLDTGGLGTVEGDDAAKAADGAAAVHDAAVEGAAQAEVLAALLDVSDQDDIDGEPVEPHAETVPPPVSDQPGGLGAVEGEEAVEAVDGADAAGEAVFGEKEPEAAGEAVAEHDTEAVPGSENVGEEVDTVTEAEGLGSVDADEVVAEGAGADVADVESASEVEDVAVEGDAGDDESESGDSGAGDEAVLDADPVAESEGLGSVEGDDMAAGVDDAPEVHEAAAAGQDVAEELAAESGDDVDAEELADAEEGAASSEADDAAVADTKHAVESVPPAAESRSATTGGGSGGLIRRLLRQPRRR